MTTVIALIISISVPIKATTQQLYAKYKMNISLRNMYLFNDILFQPAPVILFTKHLSALQSVLQGGILSLATVNVLEDSGIGHRVRDGDGGHAKVMI